MKPLSALKYVIRNKKKALTLVLSICLGVFLVYFPGMIINQTTYLVKNVYEKTFTRYSYVYKNKNPISEETINKIKNNENVAKVLPAGNGQLSFPILLGNTSCEALFIKKDYISSLMKDMNLKLIEGRLPKESPQEMIIHKKVALSKGLKVNDVIFNNVTIVGIMDGPSIINFASIPNSSEENLTKEGLMVVAKKNKINELNSFLEALPAKEIRISNLNSYQNAYNKGNKFLSSISLVLEALVIIVLSITLGNISYINIHRRKKELGILLAIGYTKKLLYKKLIKETIICCIVGYISGIFVTISIGWILNAALLIGKGFEIPLLDTNIILATLFIPIFAIIFCLIPAIKALKNTDVIEIIEGIHF